MELFYKRPLLLSLFCFLSACLVGAFFRAVSSVFFFAAALGAFLIVLFLLILNFSDKPLRERLFTVCLCLVMTAVGFWNSYIFFERTIPSLEGITGEVTAKAELQECTYSASYQTVYLADIRQLNGEKADFRAELVLEGAAEWQPNDILTLTATPESFSENIYGYSERNNNFSKGILLRLQVSTAEKCGERKASVFDRVRRSVIQRIDGFEFQSASSLIKALLLGESDRLPAGTAPDFNRLGISHILAISGLHFTTLLGMLTYLLTLCGMNKKHIFILLIPVSLFYMGLTGFSVSVCRAGIMAILTFAAFLCGRSRDAYTALFISVSLLLLLHPYEVLSIGLWLSFTATFTILILLELITENRLRFLTAHPRLYKVLTLLFFRVIATISVSFFTLPITASCFGSISVISPISNLLLVPLFEGFLYLSPFASLFGGIPVLRGIADGYADFLLSLTRKLCRHGGLLVSARHTFLMIVSAAAILMTLFLLAVRLRHKLFVLLPSAAGVVLCTAFLLLFPLYQNAHTELTFYTCGANDGVLLSDGGKALCIDISTGASDAARFGEYIADLSHSPELSGYILTHYHTGHISQIRKLLTRTYVGTLYLPNALSEKDADILDAILAEAEERGTAVIIYPHDSPIRIGRSEFVFFTPQRISRSTHPILSFFVSGGGKKVLYLGSSFCDGDLSVLESYIECADLLLFGQHSPVTKRGVPLSMRGYPVFGNSEIADLFGGADTGCILPENGAYTFRLR